MPHRSSVAGVDHWADFDWVVWQVEVLDPEQQISEAYDAAGMAFLLAEDSREKMAGFAAQLGCVYEGCKDDGSYGSDNEPCYTWWFRVPQTKHVQRSPKGWPVAVEELRQLLNRVIRADTQVWSGRVDGLRTRAFSRGESVPLLL